jgi:hypothetical protein
MDNITEAVVSILTLIVGAAILALIVSKNSNTVAVIGAGGNAFSNMLATAMGPVTGYMPAGQSGVASQMSLYGGY